MLQIKYWFETKNFMSKLAALFEFLLEFILCIQIRWWSMMLRLSQLTLQRPVGSFMESTRYTNTDSHSYTDKQTDRQAHTSGFGADPGLFVWVGGQLSGDANEQVNQI